MTFIGIVCDNTKYEIIKKNIQKNMNKNNITLININNDSIKNLKNVRFDILIFMERLENLNNKKQIIQLSKNLRYLLINSDIQLAGISNIEANIITFGLNHTATVTFSSITKDTILVSVQRGFLNKNDILIEVGEYEISPKHGVNLYEMLVEFIIKKLLL